MKKKIQTISTVNVSQVTRQETSNVEHESLVDATSDTENAAEKLKKEIDAAMQDYMTDYKNAMDQTFKVIMEDGNVKEG
jgi:hypothetical protein